jgi:hypothetical protein
MIKGTIYCIYFISYYSRSYLFVKKCIENEFSKYEWLHRNLFAKYEDYRINERANPIMYE